ncbi:MAG: hypothetical protein K9N55_18965 [Phycisphaerae bacterium]|nr:hypothetical protein [Phycisphaerae bacterium]
MVISLFIASFSHAYEWETQGVAGYYFPSDGLWNSSCWSGEARLICWDTDLGVGVSAGMMQWGADGPDTILSRTSVLQISDKLQGDLQYIPLGISVLRKFDMDSDTQKLQIDAGLHYLVANSDLEWIRTREMLISPFSRNYSSEEATCDDALVARLGGSFQWNMGEQTFGLVSGGYQFDLTQGDATADSLSVKQELDLSAFYVHVGVAFLWQ